MGKKPLRKSSALRGHHAHDAAIAAWTNPPRATIVLRRASIWVFISFAEPTWQ